MKALPGPVTAGSPVGQNLKPEQPAREPLPTYSIRPEYGGVGGKLTLKGPKLDPTGQLRDNPTANLNASLGAT